MQAIEMIPSARRLIKSLRDMGYDFAQAVADVVDNSIEAKASLVAIDVEFDGDNSWVRIADNGTGMHPEQLREAMRYGSEREYSDTDLGKFGLGLKTASMSQCQCLSVASRWNPERADISAYSWDLGHIERTNKWEVLPADKKTLPIREPLRDTIGTVVLWQRLDRILGYKHPYGEAARKRLFTTCREIEVHLGMVFHKFLSGETGRKRFKILLNGNEIKPWDPFCKAEAKTRPLQSFQLPVDENGVTGEVLFEPYILPPEKEFSSPEAWRSASGPANWNQQQGFYIYRAGRMIQCGGWSSLRTPDEHTKLARIAVSFSPALDEAFKINVAKMRVQLPTGIREDVRNAIAPLLKIAREVYDKKEPKPPVTPSPISGPVSVPHTQSATNHSSSGHAPCVAPQPSPQEMLLTFEEWATRVLASAEPHERSVLLAVVGRYRSSHSRNGARP